ncbi:MAG: hypothetical protein ACJAXX_000966 [Roseivirga sp.]|jgi:hypothetical protein
MLNVWLTFEQTEVSSKKNADRFDQHFTIKPINYKLFVFGLLKGSTLF